MRSTLLVIALLFALHQAQALSVSDAEGTTWTFPHCNLPISPPKYYLQKTIFVEQGDNTLCVTVTDANHAIAFAFGGTCPYLTKITTAERIHASALIFANTDGKPTDLDLKPDSYQSLIPAVAISTHDYITIGGLLAKNPNLILTLDSKDIPQCPPVTPAPAPVPKPVPVPDDSGSGGPSSGAVFGYFLLALVGAVLLIMCCASCCRPVRPTQPTTETVAPVVEVVVEQPVTEMEMVAPSPQVQSEPTGSVMFLLPPPASYAHSHSHSNPASPTANPSTTTETKLSPVAGRYHIIDTSTAEHKEHEAIEMPSRASDADDIV